MAEDRLAKTERTLNRLAELLDRSYHQSNERMDRVEEQTARNAQLIQNNVQLIERNAQLIDRTAQLVERNGQQIQFLRELMQGHISQSTPPAHAD
ncbi:MAG: hypothetical protein OXF86_05290 [Caldilineaceae bacterium]|nr:hypothetical protein [Caldilineaceae bacterium]